MVGTEHVDPEDLVLYRTVDVLEEESDPSVGPVIVAYRRIIKSNGQLSP